MDEGGVIPVTKKQDDFSKLRKTEITITNLSQHKIKFEFVTINNDGRPYFELLIGEKKGKIKRVQIF